LGIHFQTDPYDWIEPCSKIAILCVCLSLTKSTGRHPAQSILYLVLCQHVGNFAANPVAKRRNLSRSIVLKLMLTTWVSNLVCGVTLAYAKKNVGEKLFINHDQSCSGDQGMLFPLFLDRIDPTLQTK